MPASRFLCAQRTDALQRRVAGLDELYKRDLVILDPSRVSTILPARLACQSGRDKNCIRLAMALASSRSCLLGTDLVRSVTAETARP